ncbi:MAG TPA: helix-turn-helix domain-containing protein [Candidatus Methylomirabilis sp.]
MEQQENRTSGQMLRAAREARGISREEAAEATRIKAGFLAAMEDDDFQLLPDERYLLRFLEEYARFLGLDSARLQRRFAQQITRNHSSLAVFPVPRTVTVSLRRLAPLFLLLALIIPSFFIALSLLANRPPMVQGPERTGAPDAATPGTGAPAAADPSAAGTPDASESPAASAGQGAPQILRARAGEMTWMLVTIDGRETRDVLLRPGEIWEWRAQEGFVVTVGNAGGVELTLNGRPVSRLGEAGQVIRDLHLPAETAPTLDIR